MGAPCSSSAMNVIDFKRNSAVEFSELYLRLLSAALEEIDSSLSPQLREQKLKAHVSRGILMAGIVAEKVSQSRIGYGEPPFL
jgi:hypothetical protein